MGSDLEVLIHILTTLHSAKIHPHACWRLQTDEANKTVICKEHRLNPEVTKLDTLIELVECHTHW